MKSDMKPFRIAGELYYVGTSIDCSHLIDTGDGLILFDASRYDDSADAIRDSMEQLGFPVKQLKYIIVTHGHYDHWKGVPKLVEWSGAKTFLGKPDLQLKPGFKPDHLLEDGDVIRLGNTEIMCLFTPGHSVGTFSFFFHVEEEGRRYRAGMFGGVGIQQMGKPFLDRWELKYHQRGDFYRSIQRLRNEKVDIVLGNHPAQNDTAGKYASSLSSENNPFIDPSEWLPFLDSLERKLDALIKKEIKEDFVNYAHRGASTYCPENTMMAFYTGLYMGANGIETDVRLTKDGVPVLFHDRTVDRVTDGTGALADFTFEQLQQLNVRNGELTDKIVAFEDFLQHFAHRDITFAIELKGPGVEEVTAELIRRYGVQKKCIVTSFKYAYLERMHELAPELKLGYLVEDVTEELLEKMKAIGCDEVCPKACYVTPENVQLWHRAGFRVRAWGVNTEELMRRVYESGADGMTVNFPDKLSALRKQ